MTRRSGLPSGPLAPAVAVAVLEAVQVQQGLGLGRAVLVHAALEGRVVAPGAGRHQALGQHHLAALHELDLLLAAVGQRQRTPQRHLRGRVAAHHRVLHVEDDLVDVGVGVAHLLDAARGQVGRQLAMRNGLRRELAGQLLDQLGLAAQEAQPARLRLLDDGDLDAVDHRQLAALEPLGQGLQIGALGRRLLGCRTRRGSWGSSPARCGSSGAIRPA
jgi:hypothetical protein